MRLDLLFAHCADLGVDVEWEDMGDSRRGEYRCSEHVIVLNRRLTRVQATAALAHEVGHAIHRDYGFSPANERRASEVGASLIISRQEYEAAEQLHGPHPGAIAAELGVTSSLVQAWRRWYKRRNGC